MRSHITAAIWLLALALLGPLTLQWSWNTIAPLFDGPAIQFRHALAALLQFTIAAITFAGANRRQQHCRHRRIDRDET